MSDEGQGKALVRLADVKPQDVRDAIKEMGGISVRDLVRVKVPAGGATTWSVPGLDGTEEPRKEITGVVIYQFEGRVYWRRAIGAGGQAKQPPDCVSSDAEMGMGVRWDNDAVGPHDCAKCPLNAWGSKPGANGKPSRAKACPEKRFIFLLTSDGMFPMVLSVPPGSLNAIRQFFFRAVSSGGKLSVYEMAFGLKQATSGDGIPYAQIAPRVTRRLQPDEVQRLAELIPVYRAAFERVAVDEVAEDDRPPANGSGGPDEPGAEG